MSSSAGTALVAETDPHLAEGFYHTFSGWLVFLVGFGGLYLQGVLITSLANAKRVEGHNFPGTKEGGIAGD